MEKTFRLQGHISLEQFRRDRYLYLPFDVPTGARRIDVSYNYSDPVTAPLGMGPGNAVDIGLFDSRGYDFPQPAGFRGWSGASKPEFFLTADDATPGYIRGPLFPGQWNVILGVDRVNPEGVRYEVNVTVRGEEATKLSAANDAPSARPEALVGRAEHSAPTARGHARWLKGDLHCHTLHSDGLNSVEEIVRHAVDLGLDFLAVTDHNTNTHHEELDRLSHLPIVLIPGEEITTYWGHANTWGLREWIDFRCSDEQSMQAVQRYVRQRDGLISINHPKCVGPPWFFQGWSGFQSMEVWQAPWRFYNWESLERWEAVLKAGERVVAVGGSDTHSIPPAAPRHPHGLAEPTTWVWAQPTEESVLDAIRRGHVLISDAPNGAHLILTADADGEGRFETMMGDAIDTTSRPVTFRVKVHGGMDRRLWLLADGQAIDIIPLDTVDSTHDFTLDLAGRRYVRAELRGHRGRPERGEVVWAMTNPIWIKARK